MGRWGGGGGVGGMPTYRKFFLIRCSEIVSEAKNRIVPSAYIAIADWQLDMHDFGLLCAI